MMSKRYGYFQPTMIALLMVMLCVLSLGVSAQAKQPATLELQALENVVAFTKLLGYARYWYAGDIAAVTDWDTFAVQHITKVEAADTPEALAALLTELFSPFTPTLMIYATENIPRPATRPQDAIAVQQWVRPGVVDFTARTGDLIPAERITIAIAKGKLPATVDFKPNHTVFSESLSIPVHNPSQPYSVVLGAGVSAQVPLAVYADADGTLPKLDMPTPPGVAYTITYHERSSRLATVAIIYNHFQHLYSYWDVLDSLGVDWEAALRVALSQVAVANDPQAFLTELQRFAAQLNDGHTRVYPSMGVFPLVSSHTFPFTLDVIEGKIAVVMLSEGYSGSLQLGDVILSIDGQPSAAVLADIDARHGGITQFGNFYGLYELSLGAMKSEIALEVQPYSGGAPVMLTEQRTVAISSISSTDGFLREPRPPVVAQLAPGIVYVDVIRLEETAFNAALDLIAEAEGLVLDMRGYPRNAFAAQLASYFRDEPGTTAPFLIPVFTMPDHQAVQYTDVTGSWVTPLKPRLTDNVAWITNANGTISYAESVLGIVEGYNIGQRVGTSTAGANGNVGVLRLPTSYAMSFTSLRVTKFDGSPLFMQGVTPTLFADRTLAGVAAGRDQLLEAAFAAVGGEQLSIKAVTPEAVTP
ncbi:MAG: hypothetical protein H7Y11_00505 [Armatimonadetes bacterium]|nr:hypothetical protein [Anaerolineae bacterium]